MVKVTAISNMDYINNKAVVSLMADTKSDISSDMDVIGLLLALRLILEVQFLRQRAN